MQFNATVISLNRPYLSSRFTREADSLGATGHATFQDATTGCIAAAHETAELLRCYQRQHSLRRSNVQIVHIIFTASLIFIYDVCTRSFLEARPSLTDLQFCCHALGEIGQSYGNATRALEVIILVKSEWQRMASTQSSGAANRRKRSSFTMSAGDPYGPREGDNDRQKRRNRPSMSFMDPFNLDTSLMAPSFSTYQAIGDNQIGISGAGESAYDAWDLLNMTEFDIGTLGTPASGLGGESGQDMMMLPEDHISQHDDRSATKFTPRRVG